MSTLTLRLEPGRIELDLGPLDPAAVLAVLEEWLDPRVPSPSTCYGALLDRPASRAPDGGAALSEL